MKIGAYVKILCWCEVAFGYIMGFERWYDPDGGYEMIEVLADNGYPAFVSRDSLEIIDEER